MGRTAPRRAMIAAATDPSKTRSVCGPIPKYAAAADTTHAMAKTASHKRMRSLPGARGATSSRRMSDARIGGATLAFAPLGRTLAGSEVVDIGGGGSIDAGGARSGIG